MSFLPPLSAACHFKLHFTMRRSASLCLALALPPLSLSGCASSDAAGNGHARALLDQREIALRSQWRGRSYDALVGIYGVPPMTMGIPGRADNLTFAVFYGMQDSATRCIDAFTIVVDHAGQVPVVADYFCR